MEVKQKIESLVEEVLEKLKEVGYRDTTIAQYQRHYNDFSRFAAIRGKKVYSLELSRQFLLESYGLDITERIDFNTLTSVERSARAKLLVLDDYFVHGVVFVRRGGQIRAEALLSDETRKLLWGYVADSEQNEQSAYGIGTRRRRVGRFLLHLDTQGRDCPIKIDALAVSDYVKTLLPKHEKSIAADLVALRSFLRWLYRAGKSASDLSLSVPKANRYNYPKIPSVWEEDDLTALLGSIDRTSPIGKRDFAILILAARLGMRTVDIRFLKFRDLDFANRVISFAQHKTKNTLTLPMTDEIGWALADWLRNGRPEHCTHDYVFSAVQHPFGQIGIVNERIATYARSAGISIDGQRHYGMHSLRHTLASALLVQGVSLPLISDVLGHMDPKSTGVYLHLDIEGLRACAIDPDGVVDYA